MSDYFTIYSGVACCCHTFDNIQFVSDRQHHPFTFYIRFCRHNDVFYAILSKLINHQDNFLKFGIEIPSLAVGYLAQPKQDFVSWQYLSRFQLYSFQLILSVFIGTVHIYNRRKRDNCLQGQYLFYCFIEIICSKSIQISRFSYSHSFMKVIIV